MDAPDADMVNDFPAQIEPELTATVGVALTVIPPEVVVVTVPPVELVILQ